MKSMIDAKTLVALLLSSTTVIAHAEDGDLINRYSKIDRTTFRSKVVGEQGAGVELALGTGALIKKLHSLHTDILKSNNAVKDLATVAWKQEQLIAARKESERLGAVARKNNYNDGNTPVPDRFTESVTQNKNLVAKLENDIAEIKSHRGYSLEIEQLERKMAEAGVVSEKAFLAEMKSLTAVEKSKAMTVFARERGGVIKKIVYGGVTLWVLVSGASRLILATQFERDPTAIPLAGIISWGIEEAADVGENVATGTMNFFRHDIPNEVKKVEDTVDYTKDQ